MTKLALTGVLLGLLTACGDNGNDVGIFSDESSGGTGLGDASTNASGTGASAATSDGAGGGTSDSSSSGTPGTTDATTSTSDGGVGGTAGSGGSRTDAGTTADGMGGTGAQGTQETTSGGSGGQTTNETSGGAGGTGAVGGSASGGSGGGNNETCPVERPIGNTECDAVGVCDYGEGCVHDLMACEGGLWTEVQPEPLPTCEDFGPGSYPENGQSCECLGDLRCQFLDCDGRGTIRASCVEGTWQVEDTDCVNRPCAAEGGGDVLMCEPGEICVTVFGGGIGATYECEPNPCADARLQNTCECARALCPESDAYRCAMQEEATAVACICDTCN